MNSHIQIPKQILMRFRDETRSDKKVWYLDIPSGEILCKPAKKLGTSPGYYSDNVENFWDRTLETHLGRLTAKVLSFCSGERAEISLSPDEISIAKRYVKAAAVRSRLALESFMSGSFTAALCSEQQNHDDLSVFGMRAEGSFDKLFDERTLVILKNQTDKNFVVPRNCFYGDAIGGQQYYIAPISPKCAFFFVPNQKALEVGARCAVVDDPKRIESMNKCALRDEYMFNASFLASNNREELVSLQRCLEKNRTLLEELRAENVK